MPQPPTPRLSALDGTLWLAEPAPFLPFVWRALRAPCPSGRQVVLARRKSLEWAKAAPARALPGGGPGPAEELAAPQKALRAVKGRVATIPVYGPVMQRMSAELMKAGGTSVEDVGAALDACLRDKSVEAVVLDVDSPGGEFCGTPELADKIFAARGRKKIYACCNSLMCSAAYWVGTSASQVMMTPSGDCGSVGVFVMHTDESAANEAEGLKVTLIQAGKFKVEGNPYQPLGAVALAQLQQRVDNVYAQFVAALSRNRGVPPERVRGRFGEGRTMEAGPALEAGMVDRIMPYSDLMARLTGTGAAAAGGGVGVASQQVLRLRHEHAKRRAAYHTRLG